MLSGSTISDVNDRLAEINVKYAVSSTSDVRCKPMLSSLMGRLHESS